MTALTRYQRLECPGLWREAPGAPPREVIVSFGDATMILSDVTSAVALTHWSLPAVERLNAVALPAVFSPDPAGAETLEIDDSTMIEAIGQVRRAIDAQRPPRGRLRRSVVIGALAAAALAAAVLLPGLVTREAARALPAATRADIAGKVLRDMTRLTGPVCADPAGARELARLWTRLSPSVPGAVLVLPGGFDTATHLPDGRILLQRDMIERQDSPEVAAGFVLAEQQRLADHDPMRALLRSAGIWSTLRLLATGELPESAVRGYAEVLLTAPVPPVDQEALLARFEAAGLRSAPFGWALDPGGETTITLIEGDPFRSRPPEPLLTDAQWIALQGICG